MQLLSAHLRLYAANVLSGINGLGRHTWGPAPNFKLRETAVDLVCVGGGRGEGGGHSYCQPMRPTSRPRLFGPVCTLADHPRPQPTTAPPALLMPGCPLPPPHIAHLVALLLRVPQGRHSHHPSPVPPMVPTFDWKPSFSYTSSPNSPLCSLTSGLMLM